MQLTPVTSSAIKSIGYDAESRTMHVEFNSGKVYSYSDVSPEKHAALLAADSIGGHFSKHVRGAHAFKLHTA
jgi:hypothetical protein